MPHLPPILLPAHNPSPLTGQGNNTYLVGWTAGATASLVDAGVGDARHLAEIERALSEHELALAEVLVTHAHGDHASGCSAIARKWPSAVFRKVLWPDRDPRYEVEFLALADGDPVAGGRLLTIHTPGHAPDHVCFWDPADRVLLSADLVIAGTTVVIPASHGGSLGAYLASLRRVLALAPNRLLPAHGPAIEQPSAVIEEYLAHRALRERQIIAAVQSGRTTVDAIVGVVYPDLGPELGGAARETVLAHLQKLVEEGRIREDGAGEFRAAEA